MEDNICERCNKLKPNNCFLKADLKNKNRVLWCATCIADFKDIVTKNNTLLDEGETPFKMCMSCKEEKNLNSFTKDKSKAGGTRATCKKCDKPRLQKANEHTGKERRARFLLKKEEQLKDQTDKKCSNCQETLPLTLFGNKGTASWCKTCTNLRHRRRSVNDKAYLENRRKRAKVYNNYRKNSPQAEEYKERARERIKGYRTHRQRFEKLCNEYVRYKWDLDRLIAHVAEFEVFTGLTFQRAYDIRYENYYAYVHYILESFKVPSKTYNEKVAILETMRGIFSNRQIRKMERSFYRAINYTPRRLRHGDQTAEEELLKVARFIIEIVDDKHIPMVKLTGSDLYD